MQAAPEADGAEADGAGELPAEAVQAAPEADGAAEGVAGVAELTRRDVQLTPDQLVFLGPLRRRVEREHRVLVEAGRDDATAVLIGSAGDVRDATEAMLSRPVIGRATVRLTHASRRAIMVANQDGELEQEMRVWLDVAKTELHAYGTQAACDRAAVVISERFDVKVTSATMDSPIARLLAGVSVHTTITVGNEDPETRMMKVTIRGSKSAVEKAGHALHLYENPPTAALRYARGPSERYK